MERIRYRGLVWQEGEASTTGEAGYLPMRGYALRGIGVTGRGRHVRYTAIWMQLKDEEG